MLKANAVVRLAKRGVSDHEGDVDAHCVVRAVTRSRGRERRVARSDLEGRGTIPSFEELLKSVRGPQKEGRLQMINRTTLITIILRLEYHIIITAGHPETSAARASVERSKSGARRTVKGQSSDARGVTDGIATTVRVTR